MAEPQNDGRTPERYETTDPRNPPNSVANDSARRLALRGYLGPLVALFIVIGLGLIYWANRAPIYDGVDDGRVGTTGEIGIDAVGERGNAGTAGGFDPAARPDSTSEELERRGVGSPNADLPGLVKENTLTDLRRMTGGDPSTMIGQRIFVSNATVVDAQSETMFWIQKDDARAAVSAPAGGPAVRNGQTVTVSGIVEPGQGGVRIRATRLSVND
jgi:hypothetical protein